MINIDELISTATKEKDPALDLYRLIKAEFLRWEKDNPGSDFSEKIQNKMLKKMYDQRIESANIFRKANRLDLAIKEEEEAGFITPFLPEEIPDDEIERYTETVISENFAGNLTMKDMKLVLSLVQEKYPSASGKIVSVVVKSFCP